MGLNRVPDEEWMLRFYDGTLTAEEKARMHPCTRAKCVMRSGDSPPSLRTSIPSGYDIPDDAAAASHIVKSSIVPAAITSTSVRPIDPEAGDGDDIEEEATTVAVPIIRDTLPSPEAQPKMEKNGGTIDGKFIEEKKLIQHDPDDDPCIVKCVYFAQQCCECTIS